jgi:hypothetical protein
MALQALCGFDCSHCSKEKINYEINYTKLKKKHYSKNDLSDLLMIFLEAYLILTLQQLFTLLEIIEMFATQEMFCYFESHRGIEANTKRSRLGVVSRNLIFLKRQITADD